MYLDGETGALVRYLEGDRQAADVVSYFKRFGLPVQWPVNARRDRQLVCRDRPAMSAHPGKADMT
jgi:hypothetical protein